VESLGGSRGGSIRLGARVRYIHVAVARDRREDKSWFTSISDPRGGMYIRLKAKLSGRLRLFKSNCKNISTKVCIYASNAL
jgi:predicted trehalose synthase